MPADAADTSAVTTDTNAVTAAAAGVMNAKDYEEIIESAKGSSTDAKQLAAQLIPRFFKDFRDLSNEAVAAHLDLCEEEDLEVRAEAIKGLPLFFKDTPECVSMIVDILAELIMAERMEEDGIQKALRSVLRQDVKESLVAFFKLFESINESSDENIRDKVLSFIRDKSLRDVSMTEVKMFKDLLKRLGFFVDQADLDTHLNALDVDQIDKLISSLYSAISVFMVDPFRELLKWTSKSSQGRVFHYMTLGARDLGKHILEVLFHFYVEQDDIIRAFRIALFSNNMQHVQHCFESSHDDMQKAQLCFILARHGVGVTAELNKIVKGRLMRDIINNSRLSDGFLNLANRFKIVEAKLPEDVYKSHLLDDRAFTGATDDSSRQNLAATFVNAFVNACFGQDKMTGTRGRSSGKRVFKGKEHEKISATASLGLIYLWNVGTGLAQIEKYYHSNDTHVLAGALLGTGIVTCGIHYNNDPALARLRDYVDKEDPAIRIAAIVGLGIAYSNTRNKEVGRLLTDILTDTNAPLDVLAFTSLSLGLVFLGSSDKEVAQTISDALTGQNQEQFDRLIALGLGLVYLGQGSAYDVKKSSHKHCDIILLACAYAGSGNTSQVQNLLECVKLQEGGSLLQGAAVLGIAMVAMAEEVGLKWTIHSLESLLLDGEQNIRAAVALALGLLCISDSKATVLHTVKSLAKDTNSEVAMAAIISLGLIGAGTNSVSIAEFLRSLSSHYNEDDCALFCVRIAQALVHLGNGLLTLNPSHSNRFLLSPRALAGLVITLHCCVDMEYFIFGKYHYVLYYLVLAMQPRMLLTLDENLNHLSVPVRIGQVVDDYVRWFNSTTTTPIILAGDERAELVDTRCKPLSRVLEGFVILSNPD
ncbi:hypothetical protein KSS87_002202 [Heliosperma pusillum]|nr:hypothetical protein KSS87_002202 [Heliosperma pusillum]